MMLGRQEYYPSLHSYTILNDLVSMNEWSFNTVDISLQDLNETFRIYDRCLPDNAMCVIMLSEACH